jgi:hypothetical protein
VPGAVIILIQDLVQALEVVAAAVQDTDLLVVSVQVLLVLQVKDILEGLVGTAAVPHTLVIAAQLTQVVEVVAQANLATIVKAQILIQQVTAAFHIITALHNDGM